MYNIIGVIPARYASTRFEGKPLMDICGRPMIWWVHRQFTLCKQISKVYVALDDKRVADVCDKWNIPYVMTRNDHLTHLDRLSEFALSVEADFYININGDEPLMRPEYIEYLWPDNVDPSSYYAANAMTALTKPVEVADVARIKIAIDTLGYGMYMSRTPIPYPKGSANFEYKKFVGIQCFTKSALQFVSETPRGPLEDIEDIDEYRFMENGKKIKFIMTDAETLSVDTPKDLEKVREIIKLRIEKGEIVL